MQARDFFFFFFLDGSRRMGRCLASNCLTSTPNGKGKGGGVTQVKDHWRGGAPGCWMPSPDQTFRLVLGEC